MSSNIFVFSLFQKQWNGWKKILVSTCWICFLMIFFCSISDANFAYFKLMLNEMRQNVNTCMSYIESTRRFDGSTAPAEIVKKLPLSFVTEIGEDDEALLVCNKMFFCFLWAKIFFPSQIKTLSGLGGKNVGAATRRVAAQLLSNELAAEYTFRGTSTKKRFVGSQLNRIVLGA